VRRWVRWGGVTLPRLRCCELTIFLLHYFQNPSLHFAPQYNVLHVFEKLLCTSIHELNLSILKVLILCISQRFICIFSYNTRAFVHDAQNNSLSLIPEAFHYSRTITSHPPLSFDQAVHCVARSRGCHYPRHVLLLRAHIEVKIHLQIFRSSLRKERFLRKEITLRSSADVQQTSSSDQYFSY
jgi:hypothetical protein